MVSTHRVAAGLSSVAIRLLTFVLLRWIPGWPFAPIIFTSLAVYLTSISSILSESPTNEPTYTYDANDRLQKTKRPNDSPLKCLLTGIPCKFSPRWAWATASINIVLSLLALDFLTRGLVLYPSHDLSFPRIGHVSPTTANLLLREPDLSQLPVVVSYQEASPDAQKWTQEGTVYKLDETTDFTATVPLKNLQPETKYRYSLSNNKTGTFVTSARPGSAAAGRLSFVTSSCLKPNFPYNILSHPLRVPGIEQMTGAFSKLPALLRPSFMLFLGDFIYIDVPLRFGSSKDHYRSEYRRIYSSPSWKSGSGDDTALDLPWIHTLDDHEIENDWSKGNKTAPYPAAADPFRHYHVSANPPVPAKPFAHPENVTYFSFVNGPASFFMLDTRTYRSEPSQPDSSILGSAQLQSLLEYLTTPEPAGVHWKFVASSVPFTKNWHVGTIDTWGGFLNERRTVFEAMWRAERELGVRVVLLSGDRHEFGATRFPDPALDLPQSGLKSHTAGLGLHEFSVGPLSMFYLPIRTFAQTDDEDVTVKYAPDGNSKFGLIDITDAPGDATSAPGSDRSSVLTYSLYVDGEAVWRYQLAVPLRNSEEKTELTPGRVLQDKIGEGWGAAIKIGLGSFERLVGTTLKKMTSLYRELLE